MIDGLSLGRRCGTAGPSSWPRSHRHPSVTLAPPPARSCQTDSGQTADDSSPDSNMTEHEARCTWLTDTATCSPMGRERTESRSSGIKGRTKGTMLRGDDVSHPAQRRGGRFRQQQGPHKSNQERSPEVAAATAPSFTASGTQTRAVNVRRRRVHLTDSAARPTNLYLLPTETPSGGHPRRRRYLEVNKYGTHPK